MGDMNIQSNALRGEYKDNIITKVINEIHDDIMTVFGPGATDAYITKDGQPYYTRDGLEVLESLTFDNKLAEYIRKMIFQAAYDQGRKVGDGTTTMTMLYTNLYRVMKDDEFVYNKVIRAEAMSTIRKMWKKVVSDINKKLKERSTTLTESSLMQMLYTCTQDEEFSAKVYSKLKNPILEGAYIIPKKSNIESDLEVTSYMHPLIKATRQFTLRPIKKIEHKTVIFHCNGMLDIVHPETLFGLISIPLSRPLEITAINGPAEEKVYINIVILCNGITEATRRSTKEFVKFLKDHNQDINKYHNLAIYTLDNYRGMTNDSIEDLSTIITEEPGLGGLVNSLTFESNLYQAFDIRAAAGAPIEDLETFDADLHILDKMKSMIVQSYPVEFDDVEGIRIDRDLGPVAQKRYDDLRKEIKEEKSESRKFQLQKRLRTVYGQFIEVEVGSKLLKDSQRKFELFLDMIISAAEGVKYGVLESNSILNVIQITDSMINFDTYADTNIALYYDILQTIRRAMLLTFRDMMSGLYYLGDDTEENITWLNELVIGSDIKQFDVTNTSNIKDAMNNTNHEEHSIVVGTDDNGNDIKVEFTSQIVEPVTVMSNMLDNSVIMMELANAKTFHIDGFMMNYI